MLIRPNIRLSEKCDPKEFEHEVIVGARWGGLIFSETADLMGFSHTAVSRVYREWCEKQKHPVSSSPGDEDVLLMRELSRIGWTGSSCPEGNNHM